jgi:hypothetical protein
VHHPADGAYLQSIAQTHMNNQNQQHGEPSNTQSNLTASQGKTIPQTPSLLNQKRNKQAVAKVNLNHKEDISSILSAQKLIFYN